ncbi:MAG: TolC family protein [Candidatus Dadabacteria bacterium]|nr:MAG: TolC family protein [Candidatus Dadabacteria bacterium]
MNMRKSVLVASLCAFAPLPSWAQSGDFAADHTALREALRPYQVSLTEALAAARSNAFELDEADTQLRQAEAQRDAVDGLFDPSLYGKTLWRQDRSETESAFAGRRRDAFQFELGTRKIFPTATAIEAKLVHDRSFVDYPPPVSGSFDVSTFQTANPAYTTELQVSLRQPLWRNWLGREFDLQRELASAGILPAKIQTDLARQLAQARTEQAYWDLAELEARQALIKELIAKSRRFADLMKERVRYGRADHVDVADADANVVRQEGALVDLVFTAQYVRRLLRFSMNPRQGLPEQIDGPAKVILADDALYHQPLPLPVSGAEEAYAYAISHRVDLRLLDAQREPLVAQLDLIQEQNRPDLGLFATLGTNGLETTFGKSLIDPINDGRHLTYTIGLDANIVFRQRQRKAQEQEIAAKLAALDVQRQKILSDIRQQIEYAWAAFAAARQKEAHAHRAIETLRAKREAEYRKFLQARSEEIVVLSYDMEVLSATGDLIAAAKLARDGEVRLRTALHGYPTE